MFILLAAWRIVAGLRGDLVERRRRLRPLLAVLAVLYAGGTLLLNVLGGQRVYVVPELDLVFAINTGHYSGPLQGIIPSAILNRLVLPAVKD